MAIIREFWTDGNLIINNTGGINFNVLDKLKSWEIKQADHTVILNEHTRGENGTNYHPLLTFKVRIDKVAELVAFFQLHNVEYRLT